MEILFCYIEMIGRILWLMFYPAIIPALIGGIIFFFIELHLLNKEYKPIKKQEFFSKHVTTA